MPTKRRRFMVNIPSELEAFVVERAKQLRRPVANYLEWLIERDSQSKPIDLAHAAEDAGTYGDATSVKLATMLAAADKAAQAKKLRGVAKRAVHK